MNKPFLKDIAPDDYSKIVALPKRMDMADLLVQYLEQMEIEFVFGIPGGAIEPLYNALARSERRGTVRHVLSRHESGAAFMADGYARETGKIGVCCATSGPGATNLITGVACAYDNNVPLLVITAQPALPTFGKNPLQESACTGVNTWGILQHCTRYNSLVSHPGQFEHKLVTALQYANRPPYGPVHLSVPVDVFRTTHTSSAPTYNLHEILQPQSLIDDEALEKLRSLLAASKHSVILVGSDCNESIGMILKFAELIRATILTTPDGKGLVNPNYPLLRGVFGFGGHRLAEDVLKDEAVDLILAVGVNVGEWNTGGWSAYLLNERLVHIDQSEEHLARTPMARLHVRGRLLSIFKRLVDWVSESDLLKTTAQTRTQAIQTEFTLDPQILLDHPDKYNSDAVPVKPQRLMHELGRMFPADTRFFADTGNSVSWAVHYLHPEADRRISERRLVDKTQKRVPGRRKSNGGWLRLLMNFASMGWGIGAAIGTALANPDAPVVCLTGDGSFLMSGYEFSVAVTEKLKIIFVVLHDGALGMVKHGQRLAKAEQIGCILPDVDFAMMAKSMGGQGYSIRSIQDLIDLDLNALLHQQGPVLLDVYIDPEEVPPMNVRMRVLMEQNQAE